MCGLMGTRHKGRVFTCTGQYMSGHRFPAVPVLPAYEHIYIYIYIYMENVDNEGINPTFAQNVCIEQSGEKLTCWTQ